MASPPILMDDETRFRALAESAPAILWITDPTGACTFVSRRWQEFTGQSPGGGARRRMVGDAVIPTTGRTVEDVFRERHRAARAVRGGLPPSAGAAASYRWVIVDRPAALRSRGRVPGIRRGRHRHRRSQARGDRPAAHPAGRPASWPTPSVALTDMSDARSILRKVASLAVPFFADWCAVDMVRDDGGLERLVVVHSEPRKAAARARDRAPLAARAGRRDRSRQGRAYRRARDHGDVPDAALVPWARDDGAPARPAASWASPPTSACPSAGASKTRAVLTLVDRRSRSGATSASDLRVAEDLALRTSRRHRQRRALPGGRRGGPPQGRVPGRPLARAADARSTPSWAGPTSCARARRRPGDRAQGGGHHPPQRADPDPAHRRHPRRLAHRRRQAAPGRAAGRAARRDRGRPRHAAAGGPGQARAPRDGPRPRRGADLRRRRAGCSRWSGTCSPTRSSSCPRRSGRVQVRLEAVNSHVRLTVEDNGPGIDPAFLPHVFERFRQADSSSNRPHQGLGLGLAIVRHLVELHGGTVRADEPRGPLRARSSPSSCRAAAWPPSSTAAEPERHPACGGAALARTPHRRSQGVRILVVDDQEDARELLKTVLERCGGRGRRWRPRPREALAAVQRGAAGRGDHRHRDAGRERLRPPARAPGAARRTPGGRRRRWR